jgi:hypothetical protein
LLVGNALDVTAMLLALTLLVYQLNEVKCEDVQLRPIVRVKEMLPIDVDIRNGVVALREHARRRSDQQR